MKDRNSALPLNSLYQQLIIEHYKHPRNRGELADPSVQIEMENPTCGDEVKLQLHVEDGIVTAARFQGQGCSISQSSISMMTERIVGKPFAEIERIAAQFTSMMHGDESAARERSLGDLRALAGVSKFPVRVKCALLGWNALEEALKKLGS